MKTTDELLRYTLREHLLVKHKPEDSYEYISTKYHLERLEDRKREEQRREEFKLSR